MTNKKISKEELEKKTINDGFDLIEYPCDYLFKAMCRVSDCNQENVTDAVTKLVLQHVSAEKVLSSHNNLSKTGKFESVSLRVVLSSRNELEAIYKTISESPMVVMTL